MKTIISAQTRKLILIAVLFIEAYQTNAQLNAGGGVALGTEIDNAGLNLRAGYLFEEKINAGIDFTFFFSREQAFTDIRWREFNINVSYRIKATDKLIVYPMGGLNFTTVSTKTTVPFFGGRVTASDSKVGLNLGGGAGYQVNNIMPFFEVKYVVSDFDQAVFTFGVLFTIK